MPQSPRASSTMFASRSSSLQNLARVADHVSIWTQSYVKERLDAIPHIAHRFGRATRPIRRLPPHAASLFFGTSWTPHDTLEAARFSHWLTARTCSARCATPDYRDRRREEDVRHVNGPSISLVAHRSRA